MTNELKYKGRLFDAHTHIGEPEAIDRMIGFEDNFNVSMQVGIVHSKNGFEYARENHPSLYIGGQVQNLHLFAEMDSRGLTSALPPLEVHGIGNTAAT